MKRTSYDYDTVLDFATKAHEGQMRKYTGEPYIVHPIAVAATFDELNDGLTKRRLQAAALLHDVLEDTAVTEDQMTEAFGNHITQLVKQVTKVSHHRDGNRKLRKDMDHQHYAKADQLGKLLKLADILDNAKDIIKHDPSFARVWLPEVWELLKVLKPLPAFDPLHLYHRALGVVAEGMQDLGFNGELTSAG